MNKDKKQAFNLKNNWQKEWVSYLKEEINKI